MDDTSTTGAFSDEEREAELAAQLRDYAQGLARRRNGKAGPALAGPAPTIDVAGPGRALGRRRWGLTVAAAAAAAIAVATALWWGGTSPERSSISTDEQPGTLGELPRYTLPAPWTLTSVEDRGIWTPEQQARQATADAASLSELPTPRSVRIQGFRPVTTPEDLPVAVPELTIELAVFDSEATRQHPNWDDGEHMDLAGLAGMIVADGKGSAVDLAGGHVAVTIESAHLDVDAMRAFVAELDPRGGDPAAGFDAAPGSGYEQVVDFEAEPGFYDHRARWAGGWSAPERGPGVSIRVERMSRGEFQHDLAVRTLTNPTLADATAAGETTLTVSFIETVFVDPPPGDTTAPVFGTALDQATVVRYDARRQLMISLSAVGTPNHAVGLLNQLIEVDLASWTALAGPVNLEPVAPD